MNTKGRHLLLDVWLGETLTEAHITRISDIIRHRFQVVNEVRHDFEPVGLTLVFILSESHFTVHTYPEYRYLSLDIYVCGAHSTLEQVRDEILEALRPRAVSHRILERGEAP